MSQKIPLTVQATEDAALTTEQARVIEAVSPTVTVTENADGVLISVHDLTGTTTAQVYNGADGQDGAQGPEGPPGKDGKDGADGAPGQDGQDGAPGADGRDGRDGVSPTASVSKSGSTVTLTVTDGSGTTTVELHDGADGTNGQDGAPGQDGTDGVTYTPSVSSAGVISWTNDGQRQNPSSVDLVAAVIAALPSAVGVSF